MTPAVDLSNLRVSAGRFDILCGVSLRVEAGEFLAVLGPNGAGKTTLLQAIGGWRRYKGRAAVLGVEWNQLGALAKTRHRRRIGYVPQLFQRPQPVLPLTVQQVVEMGRAGARGSGSPLDDEDSKIVRRVMEEVELTPLADRPFAVLSGGEQRKAHLARALAQEAEVLMLDEPAGHLDFRWQEQITTLLARVWRQHRMTIVMVTHDLRHLPPGISRVALLKRGCLFKCGAPQEVLTNAVLSDLYDLPLKVVRIDERYAAIPVEAGP